MNYIIIGNSTSGLAAAEAIRECDEGGKITIISDESQFNYSRPLISYLLSKKVTMDKMPYCEKDFYKDKKIELILNKKVTRLEQKKKIIILSDRKRIHFDKLLIATGGKPVIPDIKGLNTGGVFTFTKLSDAQNMEKYIEANKVKNALVIGGGLIGLKTTEALMELKIKVTIVELADRILSAAFDKKASNIIESSLQRAGCNLIINNTVIEIEDKNDKVKAVILKDKRNIPADLVIVAIGIKPRIELVKNTPIKVNKGILVNNFMQTNIKDIYAAGDCCEARDSLLNANRSIAVWPLAARQGKIAGYNMAGAKKEYKGGFAMNCVELCGVPTVSIGETCAEEKDRQIIEDCNEEKFIYKKIVLKKNRIIGAIFIGNIERAGIYTGLIKDKIDVTSFKAHLLKEDFGLISLPKEYRKHLVVEEAAII